MGTTCNIKKIYDDLNKLLTETRKAMIKSGPVSKQLAIDSIVKLSAENPLVNAWGKGITDGYSEAKTIMTMKTAQNKATYTNIINSLKNVDTSRIVDDMKPWDASKPGNVWGQRVSEKQAKTMSGYTTIDNFGNPFLTGDYGNVKMESATADKDSELATAHYYDWLVNNKIPINYTGDTKQLDIRRNWILNHLDKVNNADRIMYKGTAAGKKINHVTALIKIAEDKLGKVEHKPTKQTTMPSTIPDVQIANSNWTRNEAKKNPDYVYIFGDNTNDRVNTKYVPKSTQAVVRGLPNAFGIDTKKSRSEQYTDKDYDKYVKYLDKVFKELNKQKANGVKFIVSKNGIATGKAELPPRLHNELAKRFNAFVGKELIPVNAQKSGIEDRDTPEFDKLPSYSQGQHNMTYAGIGSRGTPKEVLGLMTKAATWLEGQGYKLQTGYKRRIGNKITEEGADQAFSKGTENKELFGPDMANDLTRQIANEIHPNLEGMKQAIYNKWVNKVGDKKAKEYSEGAANLQARNTYQVFGANLDTPVDFVLFYAKETSNPLRPAGGTGQAVEMARRKGIPTINMGDKDWRKQLKEAIKKAKSNQDNKSVNKSNKGITPKDSLKNVEAMADVEVPDGISKDKLGKVKHKSIKQTTKPSTPTTTSKSNNDNSTNSQIPDINKVFNNNKDLQNVGSKEQYIQYIKGIQNGSIADEHGNYHTNSAVNDIVYHGTANTFDRFDLSRGGENTGKAADNKDNLKFDSEYGFFMTDAIGSTFQYALAPFFKQLTDKIHLVEGAIDVITKYKYFDKKAYSELQAANPTYTEQLKSIVNSDKLTKSQKLKKLKDTRASLEELEDEKGILNKIANYLESVATAKMLIKGDNPINKPAKLLKRDKGYIYINADGSTDTKDYKDAKSIPLSELQDIVKFGNETLAKIKADLTKKGAVFNIIRGIPNIIKPLKKDYKDATFVMQLDGSGAMVDVSKKAKEIVESNKYDSGIFSNIRDPQPMTSYFLTDPEQIHIMGSKGDIKEFSKFVGKSITTETSKATSNLKVNKASSSSNTLTQEQQEASDKIKAMINSKSNNLFILEGEGGTGKSYTVGQTIAELKDISMVVGAATAHSAKDVIADFITEAINKAGSYIDVDRKVAVQLPYTITEEMPENSVVVLDEISMIANETMGRILEAINNRHGEVKIILLGDRAQLRPVVTAKNKHLKLYKNPARIYIDGTAVEGTVDGDTFTVGNSVKYHTFIGEDGDTYVENGLKANIFKDVDNAGDATSSMLTAQQRQKDQELYEAIRSLRTEKLEVTEEAENSEKYRIQFATGKARVFSHKNVNMVTTAKGIAPFIKNHKMIDQLRVGDSVILAANNQTVNEANELFTMEFAKQAGQLETAKQFGNFIGQVLRSSTNATVDGVKITNNSTIEVVDISTSRDASNNSIVSVYPNSVLGNAALIAAKANAGLSTMTARLTNMPPHLKDIVPMVSFKVGEKTLHTAIFNQQVINRLKEIGETPSSISKEYGVIDVTTKASGKTVTIAIKDITTEDAYGNLNKETVDELDALFNNFKPVYAMTIHKSQGKTFESIFINMRMHPSLSYVNKLELAYVGLTRSKGPIQLLPDYNGAISVLNAYNGKMGLVEAPTTILDNVNNLDDIAIPSDIRNYEGDYDTMSEEKEEQSVEDLAYEMGLDGAQPKSDIACE